MHGLFRSDTCLGQARARATSFQVVFPNSQCLEDLLAVLKMRRQAHADFNQEPRLWRLPPPRFEPPPISKEGFNRPWPNPRRARQPICRIQRHPQCMSTYLSQTRNLRPLRLRRTVAAADLPSVRVPAWQLQTMSCSCQSLSSKKRLASP